MIQEQARKLGLLRHLKVKARQKLMLLRALQENHIPVCDPSCRFETVDNSKVRPDIIFN